MVLCIVYYAVQGVGLKPVDKILLREPFLEALSCSSVQFLSYF